MVNIENLFNNAFSTIRTEPKILLPLVLNWIPIAIISLAMSIMASDFIGKYSLDTLRIAFEKEKFGFITQLFNENIYLIAMILLAISTSIFISSFVNAVYPTISYQIYYKKKILISEAVSIAKKRYLKVLWTNIIFNIISMVVIFGTIFLGIILFAVFVTVGGIAGVGIGLATAIITALLMLALIVYVSAIQLILEPVVVIENIYGLSAIEKSHTLLKGKLFEVLIFLILLIIANGLYFAMAGLIAGLLEFVIGPYTTIIELLLMLLPSAFILLSYGLLYLEIAPASINLSDSPGLVAHPQEQNNTPPPPPEELKQSDSSPD